MRIVISFVLSVYFLSFFVYSQEQSNTESSPLKNLGDEFHNSIQLLQNRFRIDDNVSEITMVFFREFGTVPVVLVRPDGSKIFQSQVARGDHPHVDWFDSETYDLIHITNPVPGPWQAVGQLVPGSRVMVLSDLKLHADPIPDIVFSGEVMKQQAHLTNGGKTIEFNEFRDVVELTLEFVSTNKPDANNFGANPELITTFKDNGQGMDESAKDGVFTGRYDLSVAPGEWQAMFRVITPMFTREYLGEPLVLHPIPIIIDVDIDHSGSDYHVLSVDVNRELVDINSLLLDGEIRYPNGEVRTFAQTESSADVRKQNIIAYDYGIFKIEMMAYGKTVTGRDFVIDVPEYSFFTKKPKPIEPEVIEPTAEQMTDNDQLSDSNADNLATEEEQPEDVLALILIINSCILLIGGGGIGLLLFLRKRKDKAVNINEQQLGDKPKLFAKIVGIFKKKKADEETLN